MEIKLVIEDAPSPERLANWLRSIANAIDRGYNNGFVEPKWSIVDSKTGGGVPCKVNFKRILGDEWNIVSPD